MKTSVMIKIKISFFCLLFICSKFLYAQYYQTINTKRVANFENHLKNVRSIGIDSVKFQTDSILYPFPVLQQLDYDCFSPEIASWIGGKVVIQENGMNLFFNYTKDTIKIKTNARINDKWIAFHIVDSISIEATVTCHDTMSFIGITDSVKTIAFQGYDKNMDSLALDINEMTIQISKTNGFVKTFNFYQFPDVNVEYPFEEFEEYKLIGLSNPEVGIQNLTWSEVYDFQVGDELHIVNESSYWDMDGGYSTTSKIIFIYLDRTDYEDSIVYRYARKQSISNNNNGETLFTFINDTVNTIIKPLWFLEKLPGEPIINDWETYNYYMINSIPITKTKSTDIYIKSEDSCWSMLIYDDCFRANKYIKGLGGPYYSCTNPFALGGMERKLVYYKKDETNWGNPLVITNLSNTKVNSNIRVFPNPAKDIITINIKDSKYDSFTINIYDTNGKLIKTKRLDPRDSNLNISDIKTGIYVYKVFDKESLIKIDKIVINNACR